METQVKTTAALIQIFAKPPVPGKVKTRLIPDLGKETSTRVYRYCLDHTLKLARQSGIDYQLWLTETSEDAIFKKESIRLQHGPDLGARMYSAINHGLAEQGYTSGVVLIGSDCLDMTCHHLHLAIEALASNDIVLLPTFDGGYGLIGCKRIEPGLFAQVTWSEAEVLQQTMRNARSLGYRVSLLETVRDIDTLHDLNHYDELRSLVTNP